LGQRRFQERLGWVAAYQEGLCTYAQLLTIVHAAEKQVKHAGLNQATAATFAERTPALPLTPRGQQFQAQVVAYLAEEGYQIPAATTLLAYLLKEWEHLCCGRFLRRAQDGLPDRARHAVPAVARSGSLP